MSHKTLVNGTVYEVDGGKTLIDGVAYSIKNGKTLVGGTVYEVGFDNGMRKITVTRDYDGTSYGSTGAVRISLDETSEDIYFRDNGACDGLPYSTWTSPATIEVPVGTPFYCFAEYEGCAFEVILNGSVVSSKKDWFDYGWYTVTKNVTIAMTKGYSDTYGCPLYTITITEE